MALPPQQHRPVGVPRCFHGSVLVFSVGRGRQVLSPCRGHDGLIRRRRVGSRFVSRVAAGHVGLVRRGFVGGDSSARPGTARCLFALVARDRTGGVGRPVFRVFVAGRWGAWPPWLGVVELVCVFPLTFLGNVGVSRRRFVRPSPALSGVPFGGFVGDAGPVPRECARS